MDIRLISLTLHNFKGIRDFTFSPNGANAAIYGDNAVGKTTLYDAFLWMLFDKDSQNKKDFEIKTLDPTGQVIHGLDHEVEGILEQDGRTVTLRKVYSEKFTKKRGSAQSIFTGNTTDYFIDGVPVQKKEYDARITGIADENIFRLLTNPGYFNECLHWQDRRKLLLKICGGISDQDVIASDYKLSQLPIILGDHGMDDYRKIVTAKRAKINDELKQIPVRIDEATRALPDLSQINDPASLPDDIAKLRKAISAKEQEITRIENGGEILEKTKQLRVLEIEMLEALKRDRGGFDSLVQDKQRDLSAAQGRVIRLETDISSAEYSANRYRSQVADLEKAMAEGRQQWGEINAEQFTFEQPSICPTCGQMLPDEKLQVAREKALADFNLNKAQRLEANVTKGKSMKAEGDRLNGEIAAIEKQITDDRKSLEAERLLISSFQDGIKALQQQSAEHNGGDAYAAKAAEKARIDREIEALEAGNSDAISNIHGVIYGLTGSLTVLEDAQAKVRQREQGQRRIAELEKQEKELAAEWEQLEQHLFLCDTFTRAKVNLLDEKINSRFKMARFRMFSEQINGGLAECCETTYQGVPYADLNHGAKLNIGLDIISTLIGHYGFSAPVFVDNAEAVTKLLEIPAQVIRLVVSAEDKSLRVQTEEAAKIA